MSGVFVVGVGLHPFGRFPERSVTQLGVAAARAALADAAPEAPIDAVFCGSVYGGVAVGHKVCTAIARTTPLAEAWNELSSEPSALSRAMRLRVAPLVIVKAPPMRILLSGCTAITAQPR